jgi:hypothetical protein
LAGLRGRRGGLSHGGTRHQHTRARVVPEEHPIEGAGCRLEERADLGEHGRVVAATTREGEPGETVLTGRIQDQAALHGVLAQIEALGLELIEIRRR